MTEYVMLTDAMTKEKTLSAIALDMELCGLGLAITRKGSRVYKLHAEHLDKCRAAIREIAPIPPDIDAMKDDELLDALMA